MNKKHRMLMRELRGKERMSVGIFWSECGVSVISYLCAVIVMVMILSVTLKVSTEKLNLIAEYAACGLAVLWCIPIARNTRYRLRDAGYTAKAYLWLLLPIVGWLIFIVLLLAKSTQPTTDQSDNSIYSWDC